MSVTGLAEVDITRMRDQLFFDGPERNRRLSRFWLLLPLSAVIASAGVVSDSTATVIGAMIVAPLMTPILRIVLAVVLSDKANLRRCLLMVIGGAAAVVGAGGRPGPRVPQRHRHHRRPAASGDRPRVDQLGPDLHHRHPAKRRPSGGRALGQ